MNPAVFVAGPRILFMMEPKWAAFQKCDGSAPLDIRRNGQWTDIRTDSKTLYSIIWTYEYDAIFWCYIHAIIGNRRIFTNFNSFQMFIENCQNLMLCMCQVFKMLRPFIFFWVRSSLGIASYKINMMFVCLVVSKELANCWTYIVLLYNVASYRFWEGLWLYHHPAKRNTPYKKIVSCLKKNIFLHSFKTRIDNGEGSTSPPPTSSVSRKILYIF